MQNILIRKNSTPIKSTFEDVNFILIEKDIVTLIAGGKTTKEVVLIRRTSYYMVVTHRIDIKSPDSSLPHKG
jgi:DNA-binding CsgD family transcriptional regulator